MKAKKLLSAILCIVMVLSTMNFTAFAGEDIEIATADELVKFANEVNNGENYAGKTVKLTADIDLAETPWNGIGVYKEKSFEGTFDGDGHTISNVTFADNSNGVADSEANNYRGFFNQIENATVRNLTVSGDGFDTANIKSSEYGGAMIAGHAKNSEIKNCIAEGSIKGTHNVAGIVVRINDSKIANCTNRAELENSYSKLGGIVNLSQGGTKGSIITECVNEGKITSTAKGEDGVGGIIGWAGYDDAAITVTNCENKGIISATASATVGQIAGENWRYYDKFSGNKGRTDTVATGHCMIDGLNYATVENGVATYVNDNALEAGNVYLVTSKADTGSNDCPKPVINLKRLETIAFDTSFNGIDESGVTADTNLSKSANGSVVTFRADGGVALVGDKGYKTFTEALAAAGDGDTVTLLEDVAMTDIKIDVNDNVTINLNGKTVKGNFLVYGKAKIMNGTIDSTECGKAGIETNNEADRTLNPVLVAEDLVINSGRHAIRVDGGTVTIDGGTYTPANAASNHGVNISDGGKVTIEGGTFYGNNNYEGTGSVAIRGGNSESELTINGGKFIGGNGEQAGSLIVWAGTAVVHGGEFDSVYANVETSITGGTFGAINGMEGKGITGGTFGTDPSSYVAQGRRTVLSDGMYTVGVNGEITQACMKVNSDNVRLAYELTNLGYTGKELVVKLYSGNKEIATSTLLNYLDSYSNPTLSGYFTIDGADGSSWKTEWAEGCPNDAYKPDKVALYIDGKLVSENGVTMYETNDNTGNEYTWSEVKGVAKRTLTAKASVDNAKADEEFAVDVEINGTELVAAKWTLTFDTDKVKYIGDRGKVEGNKIVDETFRTEGVYGENEKLVTYKFKVLADTDITGEAKFGIEDAIAWTAKEGQKNIMPEAEGVEDTVVIGYASLADATVKVDGELVASDGMTISYDGTAHTVDIIAGEGVTVDVKVNGETADAPLSFKDEKVYTITYTISKPGYTSVEKTFTLTITEPDLTLEIVAANVGSYDYIFGKALVLVYTNIDNISFEYLGKTMIDVSSQGYLYENKTGGFKHVFAYVADGIANGDVTAYRKNIDTVYNAVDSKYVLEYARDNDAKLYDLTFGGGIELNDVTTGYYVYNGEPGFYANDDNQMMSILRADTNADKRVDGADTGAVVEAYNKK